MIVTMKNRTNDQDQVEGQLKRKRMRLGYHRRTSTPKSIRTMISGQAMGPKL